MTQATRHIVTLGNIDAATIESARAIWRADEVDGRLRDSDILLLLYDPERTTSSRFIDKLEEADGRHIPLGVLPIHADESARPDLARLLGDDTLAVDFRHCRFRLGGSAAANAAQTPPILRRAAHDDPQSVEEDLAQADILFLQGHSGPVDGSFGRWLTLCSRASHRPDKPVFFPCAQTERCFRQASQHRPETSSEGLIDPRRLQSALVVLDGCGTFPVPGPLYRYEQSILRGLMTSLVRASILSLGISATPFSTIALLMVMLAQGRRLAEAVRAANGHRRDADSPASIPGSATAPWILVGNPAIRVSGLPLIERSVATGLKGALEFGLAAGEVAADTGALVVVRGFTAGDGPFDVSCRPDGWAHGALHDDGNAYLWVAGATTERQPGTPGPEIGVMLAKRPAPGTDAWRDRLFWLGASSHWLRRLADNLAQRGRDASPLHELISVRDELAVPIEYAAGAATPHRSVEIAGSLASATGGLSATLERLDRATAMTVAAAVPYVGARLSHLWSPPWHHDGYAVVGETCWCGCPIAGHVRRHPLYGLRRIELSCPTCSLIGDAVARTADDADGGAASAIVAATMQKRLFTRGGEIRWSVARRGDGVSEGFASATLFDPFRERQLVTEPLALAPRACADIELVVPADWPVGLSWSTLTFAVEGGLSMFGFDIDIQAMPLAGP